MPSKFQFKAKYGLLTYAQCGPLDPMEVNNHLGQLGAECIIGREDHADGGIHLHCFFMFEREYCTTNVRALDVDGCHPNVVKGYGTPEKGYDYAIKDGDVVAGGLERPSRTRLSEAGSKWADIVLAETREDFFALVSSLDPRALCVSFTSLCKYADWKYRESPVPYSTPRGISLEIGGVSCLSDWVRANLGGQPVEGVFFYHSFGPLFVMWCAFAQGTHSVAALRGSGMSPLFELAD